MWSDSFQKNFNVETKQTDIEVFTVYFVPPKGTRHLKKYTKPLCLGVKKEEHQDQFLRILKEIRTVETIQMRYSSTEGMIPTLIIRPLSQHDFIERCNITQTLQGGNYHQRFGISAQFSEKTPSCKNCLLKRLKRVCDHQLKFNQEGKMCSSCADWWDRFDQSKHSRFKKPEHYPTQKCPKSPPAPEGRDINNEEKLRPCKLSLEFLKQAFDFAVHNMLANEPYRWTQKNLTAYLRTCCYNTGVIKGIWEYAKEYRNQPTNERHGIIPPPLWEEGLELGVDLSIFVDTPMHMLFLGIMKDIMEQIQRLFKGKKQLFKDFCKVIYSYMTDCSKQNISWCDALPFSSNESFGTTGWQSDHYNTFSRLSLIYFGYLEDLKDQLDHDAFVALKQMLVLWFSLLSNLFGDGECDPNKVDDYVKLFLSFCCIYGTRTSDDGKFYCFFKKTSNFFSMLNLRGLFERFLNMKVLWEGEREKYIKFLKEVLKSLQGTETFLTNVLEKFLQSHCLDEIMEGNSVYSPVTYERSAEYKVYKDWKKFKTETWDEASLISGIKIQGRDELFICFVKEKDSGIEEGDRIKLLKCEFDDGKGQMRLNLFYAPLFFNLKDSQPQFEELTFKDRETLNSAITDTFIIHPMVKKTGEYQKRNGHTVISYGWMVRTSDGSYQRIRPQNEIFSELSLL
jgi:hypothetical protein